MRPRPPRLAARAAARPSGHRDGRQRAAGEAQRGLDGEGPGFFRVGDGWGDFQGEKTGGVSGWFDVFWRIFVVGNGVEVGWKRDST